MKPHVIREHVNLIRDIALEHHASQQLRERISQVVNALVAMAEGDAMLDFKAAGRVAKDGKPVWAGNQPPAGTVLYTCGDGRQC